MLCFSVSPKYMGLHTCITFHQSIRTLLNLSVYRYKQLNRDVSMKDQILPVALWCPLNRGLGEHHSRPAGLMEGYISTFLPGNKPRTLGWKLLLYLLNKILVLVSTA
jgi:hypothetical protein